MQRIENLFVVLDIMSAIVIVVTLNLVQKHNKAWAAYAAGTALFTAVMIYNKLPGMILMGVVLTITAIKNYLKGRRDG
jgi:chromate transport protein ChrA